MFWQVERGRRFNFSVQDGKRLAQTPVKQPSTWELNRARKIAQASVDKRVVSGIRLMPEYTPARAMLCELSHFFPSS